MSGTTCEQHAGCSKSPSSKAAASEEVRRTLRYVEPLSDARTMLADFFSILLGLHQHLHKLLRFGNSPVPRAEDLVADNPLSIDHEGHREAPSAIGQSHAIVGIVEDGKCQVVLLLKRSGDRSEERRVGKECRCRWSP